MKYIKWCLYFVLNIPVMLLSYCLNPIVVLFMDKNGELPHCLKLFQTWDNSCLAREVVHDHYLPNFLLYDFDKHYSERWDKSDKELAKKGCGRYYTDCINDDFTIKERVQKYICATYWLTRNCGYGFAFWWFGEDIDGEIKIIESKKNLTCICTTNNAFGITCSKKWLLPLDYYIEANIWFGWKFWNGFCQDGLRRAMFATRVLAFRVHKEENI